MISPVLILHGGAGNKFTDAARRERIQGKLLKTLDQAYACLCDQNALEAVTLAVRLMEDDEDFNAGTGSRLQADGRARLSASVMDGTAERFAGVINIENIKNPVLVAKALLEKDFRVMAADEAAVYAHSLGFDSVDTRTPEAVRRWKTWKEKGFDTVGACALDAEGHLAAATSTGGRGFETPGRVSDSGMPIANYANAHCALSATGIGEDIIDQGLSVKIATRAQDGLALADAFAKTFKEVRAKNRLMGAVGLDRQGNVAWDTTTDVLIYAWKNKKTMEIFKA